MDKVKLSVEEVRHACFVIGRHGNEQDVALCKTLLSTATDAIDELKVAIGAKCKTAEIVKIYTGEGKPMPRVLRSALRRVEWRCADVRSMVEALVFRGAIDVEEASRSVAVIDNVVHALATSMADSLWSRARELREQANSTPASDDAESQAWLLEQIKKVGYLNWIRSLRDRGWTLERIGNRAGCGRERVRQILLEHAAATKVAVGPLNNSCLRDWLDALAGNAEAMLER